MVEDASWSAIAYEMREWTSQADSSLSRRAQLRARGPYEAAVPPTIAALSIPPLASDIVLASEDAIAELSRFDAEVGTVGAPFSAILLRSESAASSEIEQLTASARKVALAELGRSSGPNSRLIVGNVRAMEAAIRLADTLDASAIISMQAEILGSDGAGHTGGWRSQQVWIGGGYGNSPHGAAFVPPHHSRVAGLMDDLVAFATRADLPALVQIAIAHAQFETIHPFTDGNGRTGRALAQSMLRRLGITRNVAVPVSAGLLSDTRGYFAALTAYRQGDIEPIVAAFANATAAALANGRRLVQALTEIRQEWQSSTSARANSAGRRLLDVLQRQPVVDANLAAVELGVTPMNAQAGIDRLVADGILRQIGSASRNRAYEATQVLEALDDFAERAKRRM